MTIRRTPFRFALAFLLVALACDLSGACAWASQEAKCHCAGGYGAGGYGAGVSEAPSPEKGDVSTDSEAPVLEQAATPPPETGRLNVAHPEGAAHDRPVELPSSPVSRIRELSIGSGSAPIYLRHCSFLC